MLPVLLASDAPAGRPDPRVAEACAAVSAADLERQVRALSFPRSLGHDIESNQRAAAWLEGTLREVALDVERHGMAENIVARPRGLEGACTLVGAHYDTVPGTPGADDNASGVAAVLAVARLVAGITPPPPVAFAFWNGEESGLLGSREMAARGVPGLSFDAVHVLEMVGFCSHEPSSQRVPPGLPIRLPDRGDFLALVANDSCRPVLSQVLAAANTYAPGFPVLGMVAPAGLELAAPDLLRSDHAPFWSAGVPATRWTDTAEFRNPHYHRPSDRPETLDYAFLCQVTRVLAASLFGETV